MAYYSLVASLPSLQIGDDAPVSVEQYIENCSQWVTERETGILKSVLLDQPIPSPSPLFKAWYDIETQIRNAVAKHRGQKLGVDYKEYLQSHDGFNGTIEVMVNDAFTRNDPVELEQALSRTRWQMAEELIDDPFGFEKVLAYGIQLKIVERWSTMDVSLGKENIEAVITANTEKEEVADSE